MHLSLGSPGRLFVVTATAQQWEGEGDYEYEGCEEDDSQDVDIAKYIAHISRQLGMYENRTCSFRSLAPWKLR
ncbi:hypothetical protein IscW_ISCW011928 [Ixodes scapularis]|uniref:Uncharacterized protein n=1 Tax=Ixodes scapularis TaxID=6945 RepID=B7QEC5_IXOSC|nr:hypothetical protein IscW_ISCW011928 [Ixodes scapularis]|eukprot:XP_002413889.1 hypothetical protein IscW_ISCW011928 [Ixodes scapularis]